MEMMETFQVTLKQSRVLEYSVVMCPKRVRRELAAVFPSVELGEDLVIIPTFQVVIYLIVGRISGASHMLSYRRSASFVFPVPHSSCEPFPRYSTPRKLSMTLLVWDQRLRRKKTFCWKRWGNTWVEHLFASQIEFAVV